MWLLFGEVSSSSGCLGMGYVILLWHSLGLPYNYFSCREGGTKRLCGLYCLFWCQSFGDVHLMFVHYTFSAVWVAEWPPFGKKLPARLAICSHCLLSICNFYLFPILVLRAGIDF